MTTDFGNDEALLRQARAALERGGRPSEAVFAAVHDAARMHAAWRAERRERLRRIWHLTLAGVGAAAAAAVVLMASLTQPSTGRAPTSAVSPVASVAALASDVSQEDALALMVVFGGNAMPAVEDEAGIPLTESLLTLQEKHGGFEDAHALYASF